MNRQDVGAIILGMLIAFIFYADLQSRTIVPFQCYLMLHVMDYLSNEAYPEGVANKLIIVSGMGLSLISPLEDLKVLWNVADGQSMLSVRDCRLYIFKTMDYAEGKIAFNSEILNQYLLFASADNWFYSNFLGVMDNDYELPIVDKDIVLDNGGLSYKSDAYITCVKRIIVDQSSLHSLQTMVDFTEQKHWRK